MSDWVAKRFWKTTDVQAADGGFEVKLDSRSVKTPAKAPLIVPTQAMAEAIAAEWDAQAEKIDPAIMPMTRTANAAIDKVTHQHAEVADMLAAYGDADLLCYRADSPKELVQRQEQSWGALLDWADETYGVRLEPRVGVVHAPQSPKALALLTAEVHALSNFELASFHDLVSISGSLIIGFAATHEDHSSELLWQASRIDETYQESLWGVDEEAQEMAEHKKAAFLHARKAYKLCQSDKIRR